MVNQITQPAPTEPLIFTQTDLPEIHELYQEGRSRITITTVLPQQIVETICHIHACKQITVLDGYAEVELPGTCIKLYANQSTTIHNGTTHRIINLGKIPLRYVEIRIGPYVKDDDRLS